jgi:hypothetical protein
MSTFQDIRARFAVAMNEADYTPDMDGLDLEYINKRSVSNEFKLDARDLQSTTYKNELRFLIARRYFPGLNISDVTLSSVGNVADLNKALTTLYNTNQSGFTDLLEREIAGLGPGEIILYFVLDNAVVGGGGSAGVDIIDNGNPYEVKAVNRTSDGKLHNFKLGGTVDISGVQSKIMALKAELLKFDPKIKEGEKTGINNDHIRGFNDRKFQKHAKDLGLSTWEDLQKEFQDIAYEGYFKNHPIIFIGSKSASKADKGRIYDIIQVTKNQVGMHQVTSSTIKPFVDPKAK